MLEEAPLTRCATVEFELVEGARTCLGATVVIDVTVIADAGAGDAPDIDLGVVNRVDVGGGFNCVVGNGPCG